MSNLLELIAVLAAEVANTMNVSLVQRESRGRK